MKHLEIPRDYLILNLNSMNKSWRDNNSLVRVDNPLKMCISVQSVGRMSGRPDTADWLGGEVGGCQG